MSAENNSLDLNLDAKSIEALQKKSLEIQDKMQTTQQKLASITRTGEAGAGLAKVTINGRYECVKVIIDPTLKDNMQVMADLIASAVTDATRKIEKVVQGEMFSLLQGLGLPDYNGDKDKA